MDLNAAAEWQRLTELYREKSDEELMELGEDFADLTDTAKQILRDEMKRRGLADPGAEKKKAAPVVTRSENDLPAAIHWDRQGYRYDALDQGQEGGEDPDFTWKTPLCECETREQAWQLGEVLRRAGIDSWIQQPGRDAWESRSLRISVAADQFEAARAIVDQPIPADIVAESKELDDVPEFALPKCPACGAEDPVLVTGAKPEGLDDGDDEVNEEEEREPEPDPMPVEGATEGGNRWRCEECGHEWTDSASESSPWVTN